MFSGIIEAIGIIQQILNQAGGVDFVISLPETFNDLSLGDSIAVNGICLTITGFSKTTFNATAVPETLRITNLGQLTVNSLVNLERSITPSTRLGGHYVQGHVDAIGEILDIQKDGEMALLVKISLPLTLEKYVVRKGYITLDGMSITVIDTAPGWFTVTFIPHTQQVTVVKCYRKGTQVNLEVDILGKYIEKLITPVLLDKMRAII